MRFVIKKRRSYQLNLPSPVKQVQQMKVRERSDIFEAAGVFFEDFYLTLSV